MVIISEVAYPMDKALEAVEIMKSLPVLPSFMRMSGPYAISALGVGLRAISIYEFGGNENLQAAMETVTKRMLSYSVIAGFTADFRPCYSPDEALKLLE